MRDYLEIGIGREARQTWNLEDISLVPKRRTRSSKDVDTTWNIDAYAFDIPVVSHPTDALGGADFVSEFSRQGGLGVINAEGLIGRHEDYDDAVASVLSADNPTTRLQELHAAPLNPELLTRRIGEVRECGATVAVRVSPQNARELAPVAVKAGAEILVIQGTIISAEHVSAEGDSINLKEFIGSLDIPVIAGGVSNYTTALHLMRSGAAGIIVGPGDEAGFESLGLHNASATIIADAAAARREYMDETGGRYVHIIAGSDLWTSGDIAKAIACGADAVMLGKALAGSTDAAGHGWYWESPAAHPRFPRGRIDHTTPADGLASLEVILHGPTSNAAGNQNLVGGLKRVMAKCGFTDVKSFQKVELTVS